MFMRALLDFVSTAATTRLDETDHCDKTLYAYSNPVAPLYGESRLLELIERVNEWQRLAASIDEETLRTDLFNIYTLQEHSFVQSPAAFAATSKDLLS